MPAAVSSVRRALLALGASCAVFVHGAVLAQADWPAQPIRFIVGYPPGGGADVTARLFAEHMSRGLGQRIVVENRSGASGAIGATTVAKADPDGYTLLAAAISEITVNPAVNRSLGYDPIADFAPVTLLGRFPQVLVTAPTFPPRSWRASPAISRPSGPSQTGWPPRPMHARPLARAGADRTTPPGSSWCARAIRNCLTARSSSTTTR